MSEGQSQRSVASSVQHRQEVEVATIEERERAAAETATTVARLAMAKLAAVRAKVEATAVVDAARAAAAELKALRASSTDSSIFADDDRDNKLKLARETAREKTMQWAATHPQGHRDGRGCADGPPGGDARDGRTPDGGGSPDRRRRVDGWVEGDRGLYRRRGSPSSDRYHGHHGIQAIVRDVGPGGGWTTLTKTNYVE
jgi:hypothetical protein